MAGNPYEALPHLCDIYRMVPTDQVKNPGAVDEANQPDETETLVQADVACRMITYPRLAHQETDAIRSAGSEMSRFWLDPALQPLQIGDRIKNVRDQWGAPINIPVLYIMRVSPVMTDTVDRIVVDTLGTVPGMY